MHKFMVVMVAMMSVAAFAQSDKKPAQPAQQKIIFGDEDVIEGESKGPDAEYFNHGSAVYRPSLIKVRQDFKEKVMNSAGEL